MAILGTLKLTGMEFYAFHGVMEQEKREGNRFTVDLECVYDMTDAGRYDLLKSAVNYANIYDIIRHEMEIPSDLIENVAYRILDSIEYNFRTIKKCTVTVSKYNPPLERCELESGFKAMGAEKSSATLSFER